MPSDFQICDHQLPYHDVAGLLPLLLLLCSAEDCGCYLQIACFHLTWPLSTCPCCGGPLCLLLLLCLPQTLPLLPLSQLLLRPRLLRPQLVQQPLQRLALLLPTLCGLVGGTGIPPAATEGKLQWLECFLMLYSDTAASKEIKTVYHRSFKKKWI